MKGKHALCLFLFALMLSSAEEHLRVYGTGDTILKVVPPPIDVWKGQNFTVKIDIDNAVNMQWFQLKVSWDTKLVDYVSHVVYPLWPPPIIILDPIIDEAQGCIVIGAMVSPGSPAKFTGSATLAAITFYAVETGSTYVIVSEPQIGADPPPSITTQDAQIEILGVSIEWNRYHNYTEIVDTLMEMNQSYPDIVDLFSIGKSWLNRDIYCVRLTNESNAHPKPKVFFVGYHHAREPITAETTLHFAIDAVTEFGFNETVTRLLNYSEIYIVPALNVDGFDILLQNEWQRKNAHPFDEDGDGLFDEDPPEDEDGDGYIEDLFFVNETYYEFIRWEGVDSDSDGLFNEDWVGGVDLNRNYGYEWNASTHTGSPYPEDEDYRGPAPFSEPETQALRDFAMNHSFKYAISFHSGADVILYPWGYTYAPTLHDLIFREVAGNLSNLTGAPYEQSSELYTSSGLWDDWMYGNRSTLALTCEIYQNDSAWQYELGPYPDTWWEAGISQAFNPDPTAIETAVHRWQPVFHYITNRAIAEAYDVAVTNLTAQKIVVGKGYPINFTATVSNRGEFNETFEVTLYANATPITSQSISLENGSSISATFTWNTTAFAYGNYTVSARAETVQGETRTEDNVNILGTVKVTIPGDLNGDFQVKPYDLALLVAAFGSDPYPPNPRPWNPNADINGDDKVGPYDLALLIAHYGQHFP